MSFSFYVRVGAPPALPPLLDALHLADLRVVEEELAREGLAPGRFLHVYREGLSTRGVEIEWDGEELAARVMTCASEDEHELALALCEETARLAGVSVITSEEGVALGPGARGPYDAAWARASLEQGASALLALAKEHDRLEMSGPKRSFVVGPRCRAALEAVPASELAERLVERMRNVQYPGPELYVSGILRIGDPGASSFTAAAFGHGCDYFLTRADKLAIVGDDGPPILVPFDAGPELWEGFRFLDDDHAVVEAVPHDAWKALLSKARRVAGRAMN